MKMIALIDDGEVIDLPAVSATQSLQAGKILRHLDLWSQQSLPVRAPPAPAIPERVQELFFDDLPLEAAL